MNTIFATMIPIAIILVIPVFLLIVGAKKKTFPLKVTNVFLLTYVGVLILSFVIVTFIQPKELTIVGEEESIDLYELIYEGKRKEIDPKYLIDETSYHFNEKSLTVSAFPTNINLLFFVERKTEEDGKIDVSIYGKGLYINRKDFSDKLTTPTIRLNGERLEVGYSESQNIKIAMVKDEFPINQFRGKTFQSTEFNFERPIIHIQVPKNVEITENPDIQYMN